MIRRFGMFLSTLGLIVVVIGFAGGLVATMVQLETPGPTEHRAWFAWAGTPGGSAASALRELEGDGPTAVVRVHLDRGLDFPAPARWFAPRRIRTEVSGAVMAITEDRGKEDAGTPMPPVPLTPELARELVLLTLPERSAIDTIWLRPTTLPPQWSRYVSVTTASRVAWPATGFTAAVYGAALLMIGGVTWFLGAVAAAVRASGMEATERAGRCGRCNYEVQSRPVCPECGFRRPPSLIRRIGPRGTLPWV